MSHRIIIRLKDLVLNTIPHEFGLNRGSTGAIEVDDVVEIHGTPDQLRELADAANDLADNIERLR